MGQSLVLHCCGRSKPQEEPSLIPLITESAPVAVAPLKSALKARRPTPAPTRAQAGCCTCAPIAAVKRICCAGTEDDPLELAAEGSLESASSLLSDSSGVLTDITMAWRRVATDKAGVPATAFLDASTATAMIFACLGTVVSRVKADMEGNIRKLRAAIIVESCTLEELVLADVSNGESNMKKTSQALLNLTRFLRLLEKVMITLRGNDAWALSRCVRYSYDAVLAPCHNLATRSAVRAGVRLAPSREVFFAKLGGEGTDVLACMGALLDAFSPVLDKVKIFLVAQGLETKSK
eukprot:TRINITY_DN81389_c0_g1_i1.p1 TRINITY_DN81389_c0_g1~~TRINITY_DN81389_c0_g1_i1.p1  ORF type:complete len:304 (+),score=51.68 TRINITY_DN81389_c0_g1_i1:36-914(+)